MTILFILSIEASFLRSISSKKMSSYHTRGRGRGFASSGGRGRTSGGGRGHYTTSDSGPHLGKPHCLMCASFVTTGQCARGDSCNFSHAVQLHKEIVNSMPDTSQSQRNYTDTRGYQGSGSNAGPKMFSSSDVALWTDPSSNVIKIFTASYDGHWRLYNTSNNFMKEVEHNMGGKVTTIMVESNFLFCGFEGNAVKIPDVQVGMIHAWNLTNPGDTPIELHMHESAPYAHALGVSCFITKGDMCFSGGRDCIIRVWKYDQTMNSGKGGFKLMKECCGHAGEITGLVMVGTMLWSSSTDKTIRLWDFNSWDCKYMITQNTTGNATSPGPLTPASGGGIGHTDAITELLSYDSPAGNFVLSSGMDGMIKVWNSTNGECLSTTDCKIGISCMCLASDMKSNPILICGLVDGRIIFRGLQQTAKVSPMGYITIFDQRYMNSSGHDKAVKRIISGPSSTWYSVADDGKLIVWQISGDLDL